MAANALPAGFSSPPAPVRRRRHKPDWLVAYAFLAPAAAVFAALIAYPLADGISTAFTDRAVAQSGHWVGLANFAALFSDQIFLHAAWNSLLLTVSTVAVKLVLGLTFAVLLSQKMPMRGLIRALAFLPWAVPGMIAALSWKWIFDEQSGVLQYLVLQLGLSDHPIYWLSDPNIAMVSVAVAMIWQGLPFFTMMFLAALASIPSDLHEAAAIDGAGMVRRFFAITLPQMRGVIAVTVMLSAIWTFNSFEMVFVLTGGGPANRTHILPTLAYQYGIGESHLGLGSAVIVSVIPVFIILIVLLTGRMLRRDEA
ncbi:sugar ABC transporter permease [Jiella sp. MQZ9-1]|uniref:Sugar ABC transporter permease n=1 Tax=Jiella flava TaxID=2816857 RepID=A0A939FUE3_9HYPH|nr:sugar ABC transporter permease [Jiella flava]MBO0660976.1 sugar ABC transporter permease [Jiella flava]MCD2469624.1 sugar ABC transporter permease [Jiella flava]